MRVADGSADLPEEIELEACLWRVVADLWPRSIQHAQSRVSE
jgi:hypothetical protein